MSSAILKGQGEPMLVLILIILEVLYELKLTLMMMLVMRLNPYYTGSTLWDFSSWVAYSSDVVLILIILEVLYEIICFIG